MIFEACALKGTTFVLILSSINSREITAIPVFLFFQRQPVAACCSSFFVDRRFQKEKVVVHFSVPRSCDAMTKVHANNQDSKTVVSCQK